jgi:hypothetical protein
MMRWYLRVGTEEGKNKRKPQVSIEQYGRVGIRSTCEYEHSNNTIHANIRMIESSIPQEVNNLYPTQLYRSTYTNTRQEVLTTAVSFPYNS